VPEDAEFDGMPRAALETGMVDLALPDGDTAEAEAPAGLL
jgi:two-component system CheB/CheR fusion protein